MSAGSSHILLEIIFKVMGGLGIFLLGMKNMSEGMQAVAGERLRKVIGAVTNNRFAACLVGVFVTSVIQSSSVTTVLVVGLVNSGLMTLMQAIGVILGANIGTTVTAWILVLKIGKYGLPILGLAAFFFLFARSERVRYSAMATMGIGMVFFGLELMSDGFKPLRTMPEFIAWFSAFRPDSFFGIWKCVLVGCAVTAVVQSSSATVGITMALATTGVIRFDTAVALVLGQNIGTTVTALLASIGANTNARRAAYAHTIFNTLGVIWIALLFPWYLNLIETVLGVESGAELPDMTKGIALAHSGFNVVNTLLFLPLMAVLARIVSRLAPEKEGGEVPHLTYLDVRMLDTPALGIEQSYDEIIRMADGVGKMFGYLGDIMRSAQPDEAVERKVFHREEVLDVMQKEIVEFLSHLLSGSVPHDVMEEARHQLRMADEYESVSDYVVSILKLHIKMRKANLSLCPNEVEEVMDLHKRVGEYVAMISTAVRERHREVLSKARTRGDAISHFVREYRESHLQHFASEHSNPLSSLIYTDMLTCYRRIKDHALNIAEALAGEK
ncbi:MAG: Na/Pi cotransporter family protein [Kiritimatiellae bacterium]|nr:Na/Pi cotransporter family protein [Kiritimatiellia bacterium]